MGGIPLILIGLIFLWIGIHNFLRIRAIDTLPTTATSAVKPGLVQVEGTAVGGEPAPSPIFGIPSYCSAARVDLSYGRRILKKMQQLRPFKVQDRYGSILVDPTGAELDLVEDVHVRLNDGKVTYFRGPGSEGDASSKASQFGRNVSVYESNLCRNDPVLVIGVAEGVPGEQGPTLLIRKQKGNLLYIAEKSKLGASAALRRNAFITLTLGGGLLALGLWMMLS